jgi:hypothetical protein
MTGDQSRTLKIGDRIVGDTHPHSEAKFVKFPRANQGVPNSILLTKPFAPAQLVTAVAQLLNTGSPIA